MLHCKTRAHCSKFRLLAVWRRWQTEGKKQKSHPMISLCTDSTVLTKRTNIKCTCTPYTSLTMYVPLQNMNCVTRVFNTGFFWWRLFCKLPLCTQLIVLNVIFPVLESNAFNTCLKGQEPREESMGGNERGAVLSFSKRTRVLSRVCTTLTFPSAMFLLHSYRFCCTYFFSVLALLHILLGWTPQPIGSASLLVVGTILYIGGMQNLQSSRTVKVWF